jgi:hypothetical protein
MATPAKHPVRKLVPVGQLDLDPLNPRLIVSKDAKEKELLGKLYEEESLDELFPSFVENGYFEEEPLVVVPSGDRFVVVEGNRRLATLKLLLNPKLRRPAGVAGWPTLTAGQRRRLDPVPCVVYRNRDAVLPYLGFRHITGAKKWRPFQRARFVSQLLDSGQSLDHVQEVIGDDASATKKLYQDFVVYNQLVNDLGFPAERIRERFSLLEVMLGQRAIKAHLSMSHRLPTHKVDAVVPQEKLDDLEEVATWVFGNDESPPIIGDSREINGLLAPVIRDSDSLEYLRRTGDLEGAYDRSGGEQEFLLKKIVRAERVIQDISGVVPLHVDEPPVVEGIRRLETLILSLSRQISKV